MTASKKLKGLSHRDATQSYFWTKSWQKAEKEATADLQTGRTKKFKSLQKLIKELDSYVISKKFLAIDPSPLFTHSNYYYSE